MIRIVLPAELRYRDVVIRAVAAACKLVGPERPPQPDNSLLDLADEFDAQVVSAFAELINNVCLHGYSNGAEGRIEVELEPSSTELVARIVDYGETFDVNEVTEPDLDSLPEGGMGLFICRQVLDSLGYEPGPPNVWTLKKRYVTHAADQAAAGTE